MNYLPALFCALSGFLVCWIIIPLIQKPSFLGGAARRQFHQTHKIPVSRFGGLAFAISFVVVAAIAFIFLPASDESRTQTRVVICVSALAMFGLGFWDDIKPLGARWKLIGQVLIATAVYFSGIHVQLFKIPFSDSVLDFGMWSYFATVFWLVSLPNLINLIDGIDGLAGGIALMLMSLLTYVGLGSDLVFPVLCTAGMLGALIAFLRYNFPPASIYMGDGGAYFLGYLIAVLSLVHSHKGTVAAALIAPIFALALPILDVALAILRRGLRGLPIFRPDKKHLHHRLQDLGLSRTKTVLVLYTISLACLFIAFTAFWSQGRLIPILFGFMCLAIIISAGAFKFSRDWFAFGKVLGNSLEMRKATRYAMTLSSWLEMEAERCASIEALWKEFSFVGEKYGFSLIKLTIEGQEKLWQTEPKPASSADPHKDLHELHAGSTMLLELEALPSVMNDRLFDHLSELAAEAWQKAATTWHTINKLPVRFESAIVPLDEEAIQPEQHFPETKAAFFSPPSAEMS